MLESGILRTALLRFAFVVICATAWDVTSASEPDRDPRVDTVIPMFREFCASLDHFGAVDEAELVDDRRLLDVHAMTSPENVDRSLEGDEFFKQEAYGVFVFHAGGELEMAVDIFRSARWRDGIVNIVSADEDTCAVSYRGGTYGFDHGIRKYFYDLQDQRVLSRVVHYGFDVIDMVQVGSSAHFLARDGRQRHDRPSVLLRLDSVGLLADDTAYTITESIQGEPIPPISRMVADGATLLLQTRKRQYALAKGAWTVGANSQAQHLTRVDGEYLGVPAGSLGGPRHRLDSRKIDAPDGQYVVTSGVYSMSHAPPQLHEVPRPDVETFREYRPRLAEWLGGRESRREFEARIGAFQHEDGLIWFGTTFYSGEGTDGVGALGYFDTDTRSYRMIYDRLIGDWSCSALLLEEDAIWLGLVNRPEGADRAGGVARYDREGAVFTHYDIPAVVRQVRRFGDTLFVATDDGVYALNRDGLRHIALDFNVEGRYVVEVSEPEPASGAGERSH